MLLCPLGPLCKLGENNSTWRTGYGLTLEQAQEVIDHHVRHHTRGMVPQALWYQVKGMAQWPEEPSTGPPKGEKEPPEPSNRAEEQGLAEEAEATDDKSLPEGEAGAKVVEEDP